MNDRYVTQSLLDAKSRRHSATTACKEAALVADVDEEAHEAAALKLADIQRLHDGHIAAGAVARSGAEYETAMALTVATKTDMLRAIIAVEMAKAKSEGSRAKHVSAIAALRAAETSVTNEARAVLDAELMSLAAEFEEALDHALAVGNKLRDVSGTDEMLQPLNSPLRTLPPQVAAALARMPKGDDLNVSVAVLRGVGAQSDKFAARLEALAA